LLPVIPALLPFTSALLPVIPALPPVIPAKAGIHVPMPRQYFVYLLASQRNGTLYIGSTSDLIGRIHQHKTAVVDSFTKRYRVDHLVWFEAHDTAHSMVTRERQMKEWSRAWKVSLIESGNPDWRDLYPEILG
jgi:putative endonuclease